VDPDVTITLGVDKLRRPKPSLLVRLTEALGMAVLVWGVGVGPLWLVGLGAVMIAGSYAAYRRKHGPLPPTDGGADGIGDGDGD
jgi:hypothetical protein